MKFSIKILNEAHSKAVQNRLFELGYWWVGGQREYFKLSYGYEYIENTYGSDVSLCQHEHQSGGKRLITLDDLYTNKFNPITLKLDTLDYTLEIVDNQLKVGCQTIVANDALKAAKFILDNIKEVSMNTTFNSDDIPF